MVTDRGNMASSLLANDIGLQVIPRGNAGNRSAAGTILVADDDPDVRRLTERMLRQNGHRVLLAENGQQTLAVMEEENVDVILLDVDMPGMNGFDVCRQLRKNPKYNRVRILFMTALTAARDKAIGFGVGGADFVTKPIEQIELLARIRVQLESSRICERCELPKEVQTLQQLVASQGGRLGQVRSGQNRLLADPRAFPELQVALRYESTLEAGGDFYDIVRLSEDSFGLLVADVSGHDLGVAYLTGALKALTASFTSEALSVHDTMVMLNSALNKFLDAGQYVTACYARVSLSEMRIDIITAGHPAPLLQSPDGQVRYLDAVGDVLGMFDVVTFDHRSFAIQPGDRLFMFTDGLTENYPDPSGRCMSRLNGEKYLARGICALRGKPLRQVVDDVVDELLGLCGMQVGDDVILMGIEF